MSRIVLFGWSRVMRTLRIGAAAFLVCGVVNVAADAQSGPRKPRPPAGRDPGGVAVAMIGPGVDYRRTQIASRLARDGEGEIIAWDMLDDDARPLEMTTVPDGGVPGVGSVLAELLLAEAPGSRLVPVRLGKATVPSIGGALSYASRTPARIAVVFVETRGQPWDLLREAARRAKHLLIILPVGRGSERTAWSEVRDVNTAIVVTAVTQDGRGLREGVVAESEADVAVPVAGIEVGHGEAKLDLGAVDAVAAARLGALAARVLVREPGLDGAELKLRLVSLAKVRRSQEGLPLSPPWIADIAQILR